MLLFPERVALPISVAECPQPARPEHRQTVKTDGLSDIPHIILLLSGQDLIHRQGCILPVILLLKYGE